MKEFSLLRQATNSTEVRACGRFSADEVRALIGRDAVDARTLGCPDSIFLRMLESRAAKRARRTVTAPVKSASQFQSDAERKAHAARVAAAVQADAAWLEEKAHFALPPCLR